MGEGLENGTRYLRQARLRVVAVVEVALCPLAILIGQVLGLIVQQCLSQLVGGLAGDARIEKTLVVVGGADGQRTVDAGGIGSIARIAVYGQ